MFGHAKVRPHGVEKEFTSARSSQLCSSYTCAKEKRNNGPVAGGAGVVAGVRLDVRLQGDIRGRIKKQGYWFVIRPCCDHGKRRRRVALSDANGDQVPAEPIDEFEVAKARGGTRGTAIVDVGEEGLEMLRSERGQSRWPL
ncbi:hypothetical protein [Paraburkholderia sp. D1E]|uniref:hypothetical protein n=1 Tax=Paraburkholderia sp. D1E TaxID=3461398 RepID=UPI00404599C2